MFNNINNSFTTWVIDNRSILLQGRQGLLCTNCIAKYVLKKINASNTTHVRTPPPPPGNK